MKQKSRKNTSTPTAITAILLLVNSRSASRQPLETVCTSPPSGMSSFRGPSGAGIVRAPAPSSSSRCDGVRSLGSVKAHPRVGGGDRDIGDQVAQHCQDRTQERV